MAGSSWGQVHSLPVFSSLTFSAHKFETLHEEELFELPMTNICYGFGWNRVSFLH